MLSNLRIALITPVISSAIASIYPSFLIAGTLKISNALDQAIGELLIGVISIAIYLITLIITIVIVFFTIKESFKNKLLYLVITILLFIVLSYPSTNPFLRAFSFLFQNFRTT